MKKEIHFSEINKQKRYAVKLIKSGEMPKNPDDVLVYLSASTFLNACAKLPEYKKNKGFLYGLVKPNISRLIHYLIEDCDERLYDELGFKSEEDLSICVYIRCLGVQFSYHSITMDEVLNTYAQSIDNNPGNYDAEYKQPMSYSLYYLARQCQYKCISSKSYIHKKILSLPVDFPMLLKRHEGTDELNAFLERHPETCTIISDRDND